MFLYHLHFLNSVEMNSMCGLPNIKKTKTLTGYLEVLLHIPLVCTMSGWQYSKLGYSALRLCSSHCLMQQITHLQKSKSILAYLGLDRSLKAPEEVWNLNRIQEMSWWKEEEEKSKSFPIMYNNLFLHHTAKQIFGRPSESYISNCTMRAHTCV